MLNIYLFAGDSYVIGNRNLAWSRLEARQQPLFLQGLTLFRLMCGDVIGQLLKRYLTLEVSWLIEGSLQNVTKTYQAHFGEVDYRRRLSKSQESVQ